MSWEIQDRHLWLGFGVFLFVAVKGVERCLRTTIKLSEIYDPVYAKAANGTQAEESISLEALSTLVTSPNQDISNSATSLILSRFALDDSATSSLTHDLFSPSADTRLSAKRTLDLFDNLATDFYPLNDTAVSSLHDKSDPTVQVMCRAYFKAARKYRQGRLATLVDIADAVEGSTRITHNRVRRAQRYPETHFVFPQQEESAEVAASARFQPVSQRVESLVDMLAEQAVMTRPMVRFAAPGEQDGDGASSTTSGLPDLEDLDVVDDEVPHAAARARFQSSSNHEAEVRRQRREAMVLHEGGGVIGSEDIIHPRTNNHS
ncbi:unnamed protein product [Aureobasidium vineae]|uniref:Uncharacterized protein n=1 Tax=Aureobasidium vineae TaxID=2773715 RepID=A0A9N8PFU8_9PEZI|nr:unnamed protein product [Aureobasidium vineae]